ncbi:MAG: alkaline phosphatase D family protein [Alphaproteobacteria bacterium]
MTKTGWTRRGALTGMGLMAAACTQKVEAPPYAGQVAFSHGVASGDPGDDRIILWTRVTPSQTGPVPVRWVLARDRELSDVVKTGVVQATDARDYTVKVDVAGLRSGVRYFYGFLAGDQKSPVGKTRTLPRGQLDQIKIAVVSCASYPHGFFNAYEAIGTREDVDLVLHLGDYIYEYGVNGYGGDVGVSLGRIPSPQVECLTLSDYRLRHAQAKGEAELQSAHARAPWIVVWDDHEVANDDWTGGAENHQPNEGDWNARKRAAIQAYYEWMPIREPEPGKSFEAINRSFRFGDLMSLTMVETRLLARTKQFDYATDTPLVMQAWDFSNPHAPHALPASASISAPTVRMLPQLFTEIGGQLLPVLDWARVGPALQDPHHLPAGLRFMPDVARLNAVLNSPERTLLGPAQEAWLEHELVAAKNDGVAWQVLGNQVVMASVIAPDLSHTPPQLAQALERLRPGVSQLLGFTRYPIPMDPDAWDGYPQARARLYAMFRRVAGNAVVLSGDSHAAWANELADSQGRVAVEFGTTSITSPSDGDYFKQAGVDFAGGVMARNPDVKWTDYGDRGFLLLTLTHDQAKAEFFAVSTVHSKDYTVARAAAFTVARADRGTAAITLAS